MSDNFNLSQLTQEMIISRLKEMPDAPTVAAEIGKKTIVAGVQATKASGQSPKETVEQICFGIMKGLLVIEKDLPKAAVNILRCMSEAAQELHLDPSEMMTWAMEGIAQITPLVTLEVKWNIQRAIDDEYHGAGDIFGSLCDQAKK